MNKYIIEPEVAGQLGDRTVLDHLTKPPIIKKLHYEFDDWLGDDFLAGFQCFICTEILAQSVNENNLTGYILEYCEITKSELFSELNEGDLQLPSFFWFKITGNDNEDFFLVSNSTLIISERALKVLEQFNINHCDVELYND